MKRLVLILLLFSLSVTAYSQRLIARAGVALSSVDANFQHTKVKYGAVFGIGYEYTLSNHFSLQSDLSFIQKGYKHEFEFRSDEYYGFSRNTLEVNYLEVPLFIKYKFNGQYVRYSVLFGQSVGFALGGKFKAYGISSPKFPPDVDIWRSTVSVRFDDWPYPGDGEGNGYQVIENRFDFSLQFGGQIEILNKVILDLRYSYGLNGFYTLRYDYRFPNHKIFDTKHRGLQVCIAVPIHFKKKEKDESE